MFQLKPLLTIFAFLCMSGYAWAGSTVFSNSVSQDSLRILKRMEYKEGIPNGLLHAISLVETNIGQTSKYRPWPYTIRLNRYKGQQMTDIDQAFALLDKLIDLGYQNFDLVINDKVFYGLSATNLEDTLGSYRNVETVTLSARSLIKYLKNKKQAAAVLNKLIDSEWFNFKVGIMQLNYQVAKNNTQNITEALNTYENISIMVKQLKKIRKQHTWWESVGLYHSKKPAKGKRYVKNVWSMYQRVHKVKVR